MSSEFNTLIEMTRRGFLKRSAGTAAAVAIPGAPSSGYDITSIITDKNKLFYLMRDLFRGICNSGLDRGTHETTKRDAVLKSIGLPSIGGYSEDDLVKAVDKMQHDFAAGKYPRNAEFYQRAINMIPGIGEEIVDSIYEYADVKSGRQREKISQWYSDLTDYDEDCYEAMEHYIKPKDIVFNGKAIVNKYTALKNSIFRSFDSVEQSIKKLFNDKLTQLTTKCAGKLDAHFKRESDRLEEVDAMKKEKERQQLKRKQDEVDAMKKERQQLKRKQDEIANISCSGKNSRSAKDKNKDEIDGY